MSGISDLYVTLAGTRYKLDTTRGPDDPPFVTKPQHYFVAEEKERFWQIWAQRSFHQGERAKRILQPSDLELMAYDDGEGVDVSTWGEVKLQPALTRSLVVSSPSLPMAVSNDGSRVLCGHESLGGYYLSKYVSGTWTQVTTPVAYAVTDIQWGTGTTVYAVANGRLIESTDAGDTWVLSSKTGVATNIVGITFCANQWYTLTPSALKYWDGAAWKTAASWGGDCICTHMEDVYWAKDALLYRYNGQGAFQADRLPAGFTIRALYSIGSILWILGYFNVQGGKRGAVYYLMDGRRAHLYSLPSTSGSADYTIQAAAAGDDEVYLANQKRGGADRYDLTDGGLSSGPAWGATGAVPFKSMAYANGYLLVGRYDNNASTDGVYIANIASPSTYRASGWITTPENDYLYPHDFKVFSQIVVKHKALAAGESIAVDYSLNGGATWTSAGSSTTLGATTKTIALPSVRGQSIKLKATLNAGTGNASTPTLTMLRCDAAPVTEAKRMYYVRLLITSFEAGKVKLPALWAANDDQTVIDFVDIYGTTRQVVIEDMVDEVYTGDKWTSRVFLQLREV